MKLSRVKQTENKRTEEKAKATHTETERTYIQTHSESSSKRKMENLL